MPRASHPYHLFTKPIGSTCNLRCDYCYYIHKAEIYPEAGSFRMSDDVLREYIVQHIETSPDRVVRFSWHGGEPTLLGLDYFRKIVEMERRHAPPGRRVVNGLQTNGMLLDEEWCRFLASAGFAVGISIDGPEEMHDSHRVTRGKESTHRQVMRGYELLRRHRIPCDVLCVLHAQNVDHPAELYRFFRQIEAPYITFLPLVEMGDDGSPSPRTVSPERFGRLLCTVFDEWTSRDIGLVKIQIFEETAGTALGREHTLCIFKKSCGDVPVLEHNGDFFSCDHYVDPGHRIGNILETPLVDLLESPAQRAFGRAKWDALPRYCMACEVLPFCNGGCPKDRVLQTPDGEPGLNYLCAGYNRFFNHCRPFLAELSRLRQGDSRDERKRPQTDHRASHPKTGRNDPCPCGSGRKYKKCCMGKE